MPVKGVGRRAVRLVDPLLIASYRRRTGDDRPVPPVKLRLTIGAGTSVSHYFASGDRTARELADALEQAGRPLRSAGRLLDWGCGCGRVAQSLHRLAGPGADLELFGCDIDDRATVWADANLPGSFQPSGFEPPLPYPAGFFDVFVAVSVFTHLDERRQDAWLEEVRRVLKPDGLACLSVGGPPLLARVTSPGVSMNSRDCTIRLRQHTALEPDEMIFEPYVKTWANADGLRNTDDGYGMTFHGEEYVRDHWSRWFTVDDIIHGEFNGLQSLVLARPKTAA